MPGSPFKDLPLETLQDLLLKAVQELLEAMDAEDQLAIKPRKRQVELLYNAIIQVKSIL